jgi:hypothetical protein
VDPALRPAGAGCDVRRRPFPGFGIAVMNFRLESLVPGRTRLTTETRIFATDATTRRLFTPYWRLIYPGSSIIRASWLRAIKRRAEIPR